MKVNEILNAITRIREEKLRLQSSNKRSRTPLYVPSNLSKKLGPNESRTKSPISPCICESSYILPKTRDQLKYFVDSHKYHQIMEYKLDAVGLIVETIQKYRKRMFYLFEKKIRTFDEVSFKQISEKNSPAFERHKPAMYSGLISKGSLNELPDLAHSPSFTDHSTFSYPAECPKVLTSLYKIVLFQILKQKRRIFSELFQFAYTLKSFSVLNKFTKRLTRIYYRSLINILKSRQAYHKRTWELPLRLDLKRLAFQKARNETIEFSSADESEVRFETGLENSSQYTSRYQQSIERRDLNSSSIISNEERPNTERILNFTKIRHPAKIVSIKPSCDMSDSSFEFRSKVIRVSRIDFSKGKVYSKAIHKPINLISFVLENNFKEFSFRKIMNFSRRVQTKSRYSQAFMKLKILIASKLSLLLVKMHNINTVQDRLEKLMIIVKSHNNFVMFKGLATWKMITIAMISNKSQQSSSMYIKNTRRALRNTAIIIHNKILLTYSACFHKIALKKIFANKKSKTCMVLLRCIKRISKFFATQTVKYSFEVFSILNKEEKIKEAALENIFKNVNKDLGFRLKVCFNHWSQKVKTLKNFYLVCLSFNQIIESIITSKHKQYFRLVKGHNPSKLTTKAKTKLINLFRILLSQQESILSESVKSWRLKQLASKFNFSSWHKY